MKWLWGRGATTPRWGAPTAVESMENEDGCECDGSLQLPLELVELVTQRLMEDRGAGSLKDVLAAAGVNRAFRHAVCAQYWRPPDTTEVDQTHPLGLLTLAERDSMRRCVMVRRRTGAINPTTEFFLHTGDWKDWNGDNDSFFLRAAPVKRKKMTIYCSRAGDQFPLAVMWFRLRGAEFSLESVGSELPLEGNKHLQLPQCMAHVQYSMRVKLGCPRPRMLEVVLPSRESMTVQAVACASGRQLPPAAGASCKKLRQQRRRWRHGRQLRRALNDSAHSWTESSGNGHDLTGMSGSGGLLGGWGKAGQDADAARDQGSGTGGGEGEPWSDGLRRLHNQSPRWNENIKAWCLNFHGRVRFPSVKNFILAAPQDDSQLAARLPLATLIFGKVGKDLYTLDYNPAALSAVQAFGIALSSFETGLFCLLLP